MTHCRSCGMVCQKCNHVCIDVRGPKEQIKEISVKEILVKDIYDMFECMVVIAVGNDIIYNDHRDVKKGMSEAIKNAVVVDIDAGDHEVIISVKNVGKGAIIDVNK